MKPNEIQKLLQTANCWLMGERRWSAKLAESVITNQAQPEKLGIVLIKDQAVLSQLTAADLAEFDRIYVFTPDIQWHWLRDPDNRDEFLDVESSDCACSDVKLIDPQHISKNDNDRFAFAERLGALTHNEGIKVRYCSKCGKWRFYHE